MLDTYLRYVKKRDLQGLKDSEVTKISGVPSYVFSAWKSGRSQPNTEKLVRIARALDTSVEYLVTGDENENPEYTPQLKEITAELMEDDDLLSFVSSVTKMVAEDRNSLYSVCNSIIRKYPDQ